MNDDIQFPKIVSSGSYDHNGRALIIIKINDYEFILGPSIAETLAVNILNSVNLIREVTVTLDKINESSS